MTSYDPRRNWNSWGWPAEQQPRRRSIGFNPADFLVMDRVLKAGVVLIWGVVLVVAVLSRLR